MKAFAHLDSARTRTGEAQAQLEAARALLQAREMNRLPGQPGGTAVALTSREAYGLGLILGNLAEQLGQVDQDLENAGTAMVPKAGHLTRRTAQGISL